MGLAAPENDEERAKAKLVDQGYDAGWSDAIEAAAKIVDGFAAAIRKLAAADLKTQDKP